MKPYFIYARELDQGLIGINLSQVATINRGTVKSSGEEITIIKMATGKELIVKLNFEEFRSAIAEILK